MKQSFLVILIATLFFIPNMDAQKSVDKSIYYNFLQLPSNPLSIKKYDYIVYQNGESPKTENIDDNEKEALISAFEIEIKQYYERLFELDKQMYEIGESEDLSLIKKQFKMSEVNNLKPVKPRRPKLSYEDETALYVMEMKLHNVREDSLNNADLGMLLKGQQKLLISETKPIKPYINQRTSASAPYRLPDGLIAQKMKIRGLERVYDDAEKITFEISLSNFENNRENEREKIIVKHRRIVGYKVFDQNNIMIDEGLIPNTDDWFKDDYNAEKTTSSTIGEHIKKAEKSSAVDNLHRANAFLANKFGYPIEKRHFELSYAKGKHNYEKLTEAYELARNIFENSLVKDNPDLADLEKAIAIWEEELKEVDYSNKKARINTDIAVGIYFNIIECSVWLNKFDQAHSVANELSELESKSKTERKIEYYREFIQDRQFRYEANAKI